VDQWNNFYKGLCGNKKALEGNIIGQHKFIIHVMNYVHEGDRVLEVGSGTGVLGCAFAEAGIEVISIDNDKDVLKMAEINCKVMGADIKFQEGDAFGLDFPDDSFAVAWSHGLVEHFPDEDIHRMLREQLRVARIVVVGVPLKGYSERSYGNERWLTESEWSDILKDYIIIGRETYQDGQMFIASLVKDPKEDYQRQGDSGPRVEENKVLVEPIKYSQPFKMALERGWELLRKLGLECFIDQGTLLGAVREGNFLDGDNDVDLGLFLPDGDAAELCGYLQRNGFGLEWYLTFGGHKSAQLAMLYGEIRVDFHCYERDYDLGQVWHYSYVPLRTVAKNVFPARLFERMEPIELAGHEYMAPSPVKEYLALRYGTWEIPKKDWDYMREPPCVVEVHDHLVERC